MPPIWPKTGRRFSVSDLSWTVNAQPASQVLLSLISSKSVRCGLGLGVVGVEVAEQKPPLEVGSLD